FPFETVDAQLRALRSGAIPWRKSRGGRRGRVCARSGRAPQRAGRDGPLDCSADGARISKQAGAWAPFALEKSAATVDRHRSRPEVVSIRGESQLVPPFARNCPREHRKAALRPGGRLANA